MQVQRHPPLSLRVMPRESLESSNPCGHWRNSCCANSKGSGVTGSSSVAAMTRLGQALQICSRLGPVVADPTGKALLAHFAGSEGQHDGGGGLGRRREINAIEPKKNDQRCERGPLIAIDERMILGNAEGIGSGKRSEIGFAVSEFVDRPRQGGFEKPRIAHAVRSAEQRELL